MSTNTPSWSSENGMHPRHGSYFPSVCGRWVASGMPNDTAMFKQPDQRGSKGLQHADGDMGGCCVMMD